VAKDHHPCPVEGCGRDFSVANLLGNHLERVHLVVQHQCQVPDCGQWYSTSQGLSNHVTKVHVSDSLKLHRCKVAGCGKGYTSSSSLKYHMRSQHWSGKDSKPFKCPHCGEGFLSARPMKHHQGTAHSVWACTSRNCAFEFQTIEELMTHRAVGFSIELRVPRADSIVENP
jgi:uncharacterized C2H2 Zn-finger protein